MSLKYEPSSEPLYISANLYPYEVGLGGDRGQGRGGEGSARKRSASDVRKSFESSGACGNRFNLNQPDLIQSSYTSTLGDI